MLNLKNKTREETVRTGGRAISALFDPDNNELIVLREDGGREISMRQRFAVTVDSTVYAVLQPSAYNPNFGTGVTFVFKVGEDDSFECVSDPVIERRVHKLYYEALNSN